MSTDLYEYNSETQRDRAPAIPIDEQKTTQKVMYQNDWAPEQWSSPNQQSRYPRREDHRTARLHLRA